MLSLVCCMPMLVKGQEPHGSPYNSLGIGKLYPRGFGATNMLGNATIGYAPTDYVNIKNPASYNAITGYAHLFDIGFQVNFDQIKSRDRLEQLSQANLSHLNLWFRLNKRWASVVGMQPISNADYNITETISDNSIGSYTKNYQGTGGLNEVYWGNSFQIFKNLNVGINASFIFGQLDRTETAINVPNVGTVQTNNQEILRKGSLEFGAQYTAMIKNSKLTLGAVWKPDITMNTAFEEKLVANGRDSLVSDGFSKYSLPQNIGLGISYQNGRHVFLFDVQHTEWSANEPEKDSRYRDVLAYSFGIERKPNFSSSSFLNHITFRGGFSVTPHYLTVNNTNFNELKWNFGLGVPLLRNTAQVNIGYAYSKRGTTMNQLLEESGHAVSVGFVFKKAWFRKVRYR